MSRLLALVKTQINIAILFILSFMPARGKRIFFLASLEIAMQKSGIVKKRNLSQLNAMLGLVLREEALRLPSFLIDIVWPHDAVLAMILQKCDGGIPVGRCDDVCAKCIAAGILTMTPKWMQYGTAAIMVDDLNRLLTGSTPEIVERRHNAGGLTLAH